MRVKIRQIRALQRARLHVTVTDVFGNVIQMQRIFGYNREYAVRANLANGDLLRRLAVNHNLFRRAR